MNTTPHFELAAKAYEQFMHLADEKGLDVEQRAMAAAGVLVATCGYMRSKVDKKAFDEVMSVIIGHIHTANAGWKGK